MVGLDLSNKLDPMSENLDRNHSASATRGLRDNTNLHAAPSMTAGALTALDSLEESGPKGETVEPRGGA